MSAASGSARDTEAATTLHTIAEASRLTGLSKRALARRVERRQLPSVKIGRLRYVDARDLAQAGLLNLSTGRPPDWARHKVPPEAVAREIVQTLVRQGIELHELQTALAVLSEESRRDDTELRAEIDRARLEREELRQALRDAETRISELRRRVERQGSPSS